MSPSQTRSAVELGHMLHKAISSYRRSFKHGENRELPNVSPLENFVAATVYFDELIRIVLPFTTWWHRKHLNALRHKAAYAAGFLDEKLERAILNKLRGGTGDIELRRQLLQPEDTSIDRRVIEAAPLAALIGVFQLAEVHPEYFEPLQAMEVRHAEFESGFLEWIQAHAEDIARASREELSIQFESAIIMQRPRSIHALENEEAAPNETPEMVERVFLDRKANLADETANRTVKADAATRVFDVCCRDITWAIIDSGIATTHPAFLSHETRDRRGRAIQHPSTRIRATLDFTLIDRIRNFDLIEFPDESPERLTAIDRVIDQLEAVPGRGTNPAFRSRAQENLRLIARQLEQRIPPDWNLIEPLIQVGNQDDGAALMSDHGTHVAGILAADWRASQPGPDGQKEILLQGVCPELGLYDLRVIHANSRQSTEFAILACLEYVQFVNARSGSNGQVIHGVNISMSIPHDVRNYGCGATPICVSCDRVVSSGVVVVAAAGNRGWNEMEAGFGNFVFCSITDPGNARDVITVGSTHRAMPHAYGVSYFSSRGPTGDGRSKPDLVAPGEKIRGPIRGDADDELDGTSMAAPFVSGAAAMLLARHRELIGDPQRVKEILCASATDLGREKYFQGHGLVDVLRALQSL